MVRSCHNFVHVKTVIQNVTWLYQYYKRRNKNILHKTLVNSSYTVCEIGPWTHLWSSLQFQESLLAWQAWSKVDQSWWLANKAYFTQNLSFVIQMWWRIHHALMPILLKPSVKYIFRTTAAVPPWHRQNLAAISFLRIYLQCMKCMCLWILNKGEKSLVKWTLITPADIQFVVVFIHMPHFKHMYSLIAGFNICRAPMNKHLTCVVCILTQTALRNAINDGWGIHRTLILIIQ